MKIVELAVKRYQFTLVIFFAFAAIGLNTFLSMPRSEDPPLSFPGSIIVVVYPGASPTDIEQLVADPLEASVKELSNISKLTTELNDGLMVTFVEFTSDQDADKKYDEVLRQVNSVRSKFPKEMQSIEVIKYSTTDVNIVQTALVSETMPYKDLEEQADRLKKRLETVGGVKEVKKWAYPEREVRVALDLEKISRLRIPLGLIIGSIESNNTNIPGGSVDVGKKKFNIKTSGNYKSIEDVRRTIVNADQGRVVQLKDIADVNWDYEDETHAGRFNSKRAVFVTANQKEGQNIFNVRNAIWKELDEFEKQIPSGIVLERGFDQSQNVSHRLNGLYRDFILAILLVLLTLLPLGFRASVIVMVSIPLSLLIGLFLLNTMGFNLNQLSIVGMVIALGLLVDDSVVVVENVTRFLRMGYSPVKAAVEATKQIGVAILGCTATLIFSFLPLILLPGNSGDYIRSMPVAVVLTVLASLVVSLTIIPFLASRFLKEEKDEQGNFFLQLMHKVINATYSKLLEWSLKHPKYTLLIALGLFLAIMPLIPVIGFSLFPKAGIPQFRVTIETPEGSSFDETDKAVRYVERTLTHNPNMQWVFANVGRGNPRMYYNITAQNEKANVGEVFAELKKYNEKSSPKFFDSLRTVFAEYPNAKIEVKEFENGPPIDAPIAIRIVGENLDTLKSIAASVENVFRETEGTIYVNNPVRISKMDLHVKVDKEKAGLYRVPTVDIDRTIRMGISGLPAGKFREEDGDEYNITVTLPHNGKQTVDALDKLYVSSVTGAQIPLRQVAQVEFQSSPPTINHFNKERAVTITAFVKTGYNTDRLTKSIADKLDKMKLPTGYRTILAGEIESRQESFSGFGNAIMIAGFGVLATLVLEFGSFVSTLIVFSVVPLGLIGGTLMLLLTGNTFSFTAMVGFIALVGIEVKTSILLVDFTNQLREKGMSVDEAVLKAGEIRFVPVLLTTMTAIGGLLPIAVSGSGLYSPLAWVIIGGLISSTLLSRLVTPVMYKLLPPKIAAQNENAGGQEISQMNVK